MSNTDLVAELEALENLYPEVYAKFPKLQQCKELVQYKTVVFYKAHDTNDRKILKMLDDCSFHHFETPNLISILTENANMTILLGNLKLVANGDLDIRMNLNRKKEKKE